jgi:hypothetical protein
VVLAKITAAQWAGFDLMEELHLSRIVVER